MAQRQHYKYREQKEYPKGLPWHKKFIRGIERINKVLSLRLLGKILRVHPRTEPVPLSEVSSVLIIRYDALGDMIVTTPLWRILKRLKPGIRIGVAGSFKNLDLLRADPDIDFLYDYTASSLRDFFKISETTRKQQWDVVLMGNFNQKTRNAIISRLASTQGITATVGSPNVEGHQHLFSRLVSLPLPMNQMPMTEQLQYLLSGVIALPEAKPERPSVIIDKNIESSVRQEVGSFLEKAGSSKFVLLNFDAPAFKKWNLADNIKLAQTISTSYPEYSIILTSLPENQVKIEGLLKEADIQRAFYFATPDIQFMTALIRCSSLVVTPDTSIVHLASAENKPIVSFHLTAGEWLPYKVDAFVILPVKGEPISSIPFETVWTAVKTMLDEPHDQEVHRMRIVYGENPSDVVIRTG